MTHDKMIDLIREHGVINTLDDVASYLELLAEHNARRGNAKAVRVLKAFVKKVSWVATLIYRNSVI